MSAYLIANVRFGDRAKAAEYGQRAAATIAQYGGGYLVRGGRTEVVEGGWDVAYLTIVEFSFLDQARRWYESAEYTEIKAFRQANAESQFTFVEGL